VNKIIDTQCIEKTETSVILGFSVPDTSDYFNGHFPGFPILPAVAQVDIIMRYASDLFNIGAGLSEIKRIKFNHIIQPDTSLTLSLEKKENTISFKICSPDGNIVYSAGLMVLREANSLQGVDQ
jgi:3-hydroxymyristoyl/3-hydroxydecanoyl-(acyl carrier protein) dehydratase